MKFKVTKVETHKLTGDWEDGVSAEIPIKKGQTKAEIVEALKISYISRIQQGMQENVSTPVKYDATSDVPFSVNDEETITI